MQACWCSDPSPQLIVTRRASRAAGSRAQPWRRAGIPISTVRGTQDAPGQSGVRPTVGGALATATGKAVVTVAPAASVAVSSTCAGPLASQVNATVSPATGAE